MQDAEGDRNRHDRAADDQHGGTENGGGARVLQRSTIVVNIGALVGMVNPFADSSDEHADSKDQGNAVLNDEQWLGESQECQSDCAEDEHFVPVVECEVF